MTVLRLAHLRDKQAHEVPQLRPEAWHGHLIVLQEEFLLQELQTNVSNGLDATLVLQILFLTGFSSSSSDFGTQSSSSESSKYSDSDVSMSSNLEELL